MFIKKDRRRIDEILTDKDDAKTSLQLSKRSPEFNGILKVLCREINLPYLMNLRVLNLYDNSLTTLHGIGYLSQTPLEELNLGCNCLTSIPIEFGSISTLRSVWLDDNNFEEFPIPICRLSRLTTIRLSGNQIAEIPDLISCLDNLETLALDNNRLEVIPSGILKLSKLKNLWLRQNHLGYIPTDIDQLHHLEVLSLSSNMLKSIPESISKIEGLRLFYANGNQIENVPISLCGLTKIKEINIANNYIKMIPPAWEEKWGYYDNITGQLKFNDSPSQCKVNLVGNPLS